MILILALISEKHIGRILFIALLPRETTNHAFIEIKCCISFKKVVENKSPIFFSQSDVPASNLGFSSYYLILWRFRT